MSPSRPILGACALAAALLLPLPAMAQQAPTPAPRPTPPAPAANASPVEGRWTPAGGNEVIDVRRLSDRILELKSSDGWIGVGILDDRQLYRGVFEYLDRGDHATGLHVIDWGYGVPEVTVTWTSVRSGEARQQWHRADGSRPSPEMPAFGEYVYVEQLPEAVTKVPPQYPQAARDARVEGTVIVQALVGRDGRVKDTRVVHSIPGLDEAAVAAVRQWVFKPALTKNEPVAVWVAVPVKFTLH